MNDVTNLEAGDTVTIIAANDDRRGQTGMLVERAGFIVPGPAWWVLFTDGHKTLYDDFELTAP